MATQPPTLLPARLLWPTETFRSAALKSLVRVRWFIHLRWVAVVGGFVLLSAEVWYHERGSKPTGALWVVGLLAVVNLLWMAWSRSLRAEHATEAIGEGELLEKVTLFTNAQIGVDLLLLTLVLWCYGGVTNPMAMFYVFHMVVASILLTPGNALLQGIWAMLLYGAMLLAGYLEVTGLPAPMFRGPVFADLHHDGEFVVKTYAVVCIAVFVTRHLTSQVAATLDAREQEVRARDQALAESRERIDELHARRVRFMRTAAHQLKSPVTGIHTLATLIADGEVEGAAADGVIAKIIRRCREAIAQVEELLTLARIREAPSERHRVARTPLLTALNNVVGRYRDLAQAKRQQLDCGLLEGSRPDEVESLCVQVDSRDLEDAVGNLLDNAIKYTPEGGQVTVSYGAEGDRAVVRVRDTGPGVASENQESIFDEFRRGHHALAARTAGTGLGLAIVREIMEQARGGVLVRSPVKANDTKNPGSEFELRLPACLPGRQVDVGGPPPAGLQETGRAHD